jgi:hypothetical protein
MADDPTPEPPPRPDRCETCRFWEDVRLDIDPASVMRTRLEIDPECDPDKALAAGEAFAAEMAKRGFCHRFPPQLALWPETDDHEAEMDFRFPSADSDDWCGEWQPKPEGA